jgi:hypothetical protein
MVLAVVAACDRYECEPIAQADGSRSGLEACRKPDGRLAYVNRVDAVACSGDPVASVPECPEDYHQRECATDDDCADGGVCGAAPSGFTECSCWSVCGSDADCGADEACLCALERVSSDGRGNHVSLSDAHQRVAADCRSDADCESGECGALIGPCGHDIFAFYCRTKDDECRSNLECGNIGWCDSTGGKWTCKAVGNCD